MRLKCIAGDLAGKSFELHSTHIYLLGREPEEAGAEPILLSSSTVSRKHCRIFFDGDAAIVEDLQSSNGIRVNRNRIDRATLKNGDLLQVGAFSFMISGLKAGAHEKSQVSKTGKRSVPESPAAAIMLPQVQRAKEHWLKFERIDLRLRVLIVLALGGFLIHFGISSPMLSEMRTSLFELSFSIGENTVRSLADRNKRELADGTYYLLDCEFLKRSSGVVSSSLIDSKGRQVCPVGGDAIQDELLEGALYRGETLNNCRARVLRGDDSDCDFVYPIREWKDQQGQYVMVGVARLRYSPKDAESAVQNLQALKWKLFLFCMAVMMAIWAIWQLWTRKEVNLAVEATHLAVTGAVKGLDNLESFAALDPLIQEINRLISKENQGVEAKSAGISEEASFLHSLMQQVLLLEERAVMVIDKDNQLIAASRTLPDSVPVDVSRTNVHITEAVADTHLQGELIVLLNDLAQSNEVIDRALAMADRMIQARGMPLFLREDFVASILVF
jgi:hypothetical protein